MRFFDDFLCNKNCQEKRSMPLHKIGSVQLVKQQMPHSYLCQDRTNESWLNFERQYLRFKVHFIPVVSNMYVNAAMRLASALVRNVPPDFTTMLSTFLSPKFWHFPSISVFFRPLLSDTFSNVWKVRKKWWLSLVGT